MVNNFMKKALTNMAKDIWTEKIYQELRTYVLDNQQHGKIKINQNALAEQLGVSRTPVVKALHMLESEGMVDNIPNRGFYIHVPTLRELCELFALRQCFEMTASAYVCRHASNEDLQDLEALFQPFVGKETIDYDEYFAADKQFHRMVFKLCGNHLMHRINDQMRIMERSFSIGLFRQPKETLNEHIEMVKAFRAGDEVRAQELMLMHTDITRRYLENLQRQLKTLGLDPDLVSAQDVTFRSRAVQRP